jgi:Sel1 repeat
MSSTSTVAGARNPSSRPGDTSHKPIAILAPEDGIASGEPIDDLPPLIEPTGGAADPPLPAPGRRPPRRSFLASAAAGETPPAVSPVPVARPVPPAMNESSPPGLPLPGFPLSAKLAVPPPGAPETAPAPPVFPWLAMRAAPSIAPPPSAPETAPAAPALPSPIKEAAPLAAQAIFVSEIVEPDPPEAAESVAPAGEQPAAAPPPVEAPLAAPSVITPRAPLRQHIRLRAARWLKPVKAALPAAGWQRWTVAAAILAVVLVGFADLAGIGPFSGMRRYRESPPPNDPTERVAYYRTGAKAGDAAAQLQLAILYAKGEGVAQDYATAATWFRAAADQGSARAQYDLGVLYERGRGVAVDLAEAAKWYQKAAEGKHPLAQYNLAVCYTKGQGVRKDLPEAALWYRRAAVQGVVQAMINLGMVYEKGEGVAASPVDAYAWYRAAGGRESEAAARRAEDIYAALPKLDQIRAEALASDVATSIHDAATDRGESR